MEIQVKKDWQQFGSKIILAIDCIEIDLTEEDAKKLVEEFARIGICKESPLILIEN